MPLADPEARRLYQREYKQRPEVVARNLARMRTKYWKEHTKVLQQKRDSLRRNRVYHNAEDRRRRREDPVFRAQLKAQQHRVRAARKLEALNAYGGPSCQCCSEAHIEFLSIDHIDGRGAAHRRSLKTSNIYPWLRAQGYPPGFRVLCLNCNCARGFCGYCPHELERAAAEKQRAG